MAAAGSAVFRPSRGLLILSLLCLVGLGDSLVQMDTLEKLTELLLNMRQEVESIKEGGLYYDSLIDAQRSLNTMLTILQTAQPEMKPAQATLQNAKVFVDKTLAETRSRADRFMADIDNQEMKLKKIKEMFKAMAAEENHDEF